MVVICLFPGQSINSAGQLNKLNDLFVSTQGSLNDRIEQIYDQTKVSLADLVNEANQLNQLDKSLSDMSEFSVRLEQAIKDAQPLLNARENYNQIAELNRLIEMARDSKKQLENTDNNLKAFLAQRDVVNEKIDEVNEKLTEIEQKGQREMEEAQRDVNELMVSFLS